MYHLQALSGSHQTGYPSASGAGRDRDIENQQGDGDGQHAVAEGFQPLRPQPAPQGPRVGSPLGPA